jgi:phenylacetate-CoA ligase
MKNNSVNLFNSAVKAIPAYSDFLKKNGFKAEVIKDLDEFKTVPVTSKKGYLVNYSHDQLMWPADQSGTVLYCSTSGSTGEPYYFPRNEKLSWQYSFLIKDFLKQSSHGNGKTLVLIGFGMGVWIGGIITLRAFEIAGETSETPLAILPVGYNKTEIFKALKKLAPEYDQTIIVGYPPFVKEIVDEAPNEKINLAKLNVRLMFAAEAFTETFRNYVCKKAGIKDPLRDTLNIYGTADIGAMACETPLSILVRRLALEDPLLFQDVFGQIEKTPTLTQFNPEFIDFEAVEGELFLTGDGALPLIRYAVGDNGGVFTYNQIRSIFHRYLIDLDQEVEKAKISDVVRKWPFVFVYERTDLSVSLHGLNIFPEFIKEGLLTKDMAVNFTERFTMATKHDIYHNQFLQVNLELRKDIKPTKELEKQAHAAITKSLKAKSSEFAEVSKSQASSKLVQVILWPNGHHRYFAPGTKQKWVEKQ